MGDVHLWHMAVSLLLALLGAVLDLKLSFRMTYKNVILLAHIEPLFLGYFPCIVLDGFTPAKGP